MNQVDVYAAEARETRGSKRFEGALRVILARKHSQQVGTQGLDAETDAIDPSLSEARKQCRRGVGRVYLYADLGLGGEPRLQHRHDLFDQFRRLARCASAEIQSLNRWQAGPLQIGRKFAFQRQSIRSRKVGTQQYTVVWAVGTIWRQKGKWT
jgi:hypothetical protein